jgi:hypothetical protein
MSKRLIIILLLLPCIVLQSFSQNTDKDQLLRSMVSQYRQARVSIPFPGIKEVNAISGVVSVSSVSKKSVEIVLSPLTVEWFISQKYNYVIKERTDIKDIMSSSDVKDAMEWDSYPTYLQYDSIMQSFPALYPSLCQIDTIGTSIYGNLVLVLKISDNPGNDEEEPETFYSSSIHGDETGGFILMLRLADYLLKNYGTNSRVTSLVNNLEIWINPLANPDGTYGTGNIISSPSRYNANGYDLNRNFPDPETPGTVKQKETVDMMKFMRKHHFVISANFHAGDEVVNYPWDRWYWLHADNDWFYYISRKYADTVHLYSVPGYMDDNVIFDNGVTNGYDWYKINGGRQDFVTWELQGREITIELDYNFVTPAANLNTLWNYNWRSLLGYIENALYGIHGLVKDSVTGNPVPAKIFIANYDKDSSHVFSDTLTGNFVRLLYPGSWDLQFSAKGYLSKTVTVVVTEGQKTDIIVEMAPLINPIDTVTTASLLLYPNPAEEYFKVVLPDRQIGKVNVKIYNSAGLMLADYHENTIEDTPLVIDVKDLRAGVYSLVITNVATNITDKSKFVVVNR